MWCYISIYIFRDIVGTMTDSVVTQINKQKQFILIFSTFSHTVIMFVDI